MDKLDGEVCGQCQYYFIGRNAAIGEYEFHGDGGHPNGKCTCPAAKMHNVVIGWYFSCPEFSHVP